MLPALRPDGKAVSEYAGRELLKESWFTDLRNLEGRVKESRERALGGSVSGGGLDLQGSP